MSLYVPFLGHLETYFTVVEKTMLGAVCLPYRELRDSSGMIKGMTFGMERETFDEDPLEDIFRRSGMGPVRCELERLCPRRQLAGQNHPVSLTSCAGIQDQSVFAVAQPAGKASAAFPSRRLRRNSLSSSRTRAIRSGSRKMA